MDILTPAQRHKVMSHIKSRDTTPEKEIRHALHKSGFRYRICDKRYPGKPDLIFPHYYAVVFINGCFWHKHEMCRYFRMPSTNVAFWQEKFERNRQRDSKIIRHYQEKCFRVCIVWECAIRGNGRRKRIESVVGKIINWLDETSEPYLEISG